MIICFLHMTEINVTVKLRSVHVSTLTTDNIPHAFMIIDLQHTVRGITVNVCNIPDAFMIIDLQHTVHVIMVTLQYTTCIHGM